MHLGDMRILLFPRKSIEKMTQQKFTYPSGINGIEGTYHTPKGYYVAFENPEAFEAYEATFPAKEKKVMEGQLVDDCTKNPNE